MPRIPRGEDVQRYNPSGQFAQTQIDTRGVGAGADALGRVLGGIAADRQEKQERFQFAQAQAEFLTAKVRLDNAFDQDEDYATIPDRYTEGLAEATQQAASLIKNERLRSEFLLTAQPRVAEGQERIKSLAFNKERDYQVAYVDEKLVAFREAAMLGEIDASVAAATELITSAIENDYLTATEGQATLRRWQDDTVVSRLEMLEPQERLDALASDWAENIPIDKRVLLERDAKEKLLQGKAQSHVDEYLKEGNTYSQALERARAIPDPMEREATTRELDYQFSQQNMAEREARENIYETYFLNVRTPGPNRLRVSDIPLAEREAMGPEMLNSLYLAETRATAEMGELSPEQERAAKQREREVLDRLHVLRAAGPEYALELRDYFVQNAGALGDTDFDQWSKMSAEGVIPPEVESVLDWDDYIKNVYPDGSDGAVRTLTRKFNTWHMQQTIQNGGKPPSDPEIQSYIDGQLVRNNPWGPFNDRRVFQMDDEDLGEFVKDIRDREPDVYQAITEKLGGDPPVDEFMEAYAYYTR